MSLFARPIFLVLLLTVLVTQASGNFIPPLRNEIRLQPYNPLMPRVADFFMTNEGIYSRDDPWMSGYDKKRVNYSNFCREFQNYFHGSIIY